MKKIILIKYGELTTKGDNRNLFINKIYDHLKELLETDFRTMYAGLDEEEKQEFWLDLIKEIKLDKKTVTEVVFFT